ncbi:hypothetical protein [Methylomicrobium sp. Wu6]|uniref:hypothetical protein n=1 Tax=Methylomicrobium sp. Wu6 TaxID=3107928 RepID=UPI002DD64954|nr:hypothetical protein [Methylomicrobium sp. Wu6]MEC4750025.1 hypothetical protein [Methylomicrobium sp. Wu6]
MAKPIDSTQSELIGAKEVGTLCGNKSVAWPSFKLKSDPSFPRPFLGNMGSGGGKMQWRRDDIVAWWEANEGRPHPPPVAKKTAFAGETAKHFITGLFDPSHAQKARLRRIERARTKGITNQKQIRTEGDWP